MKESLKTKLLDFINKQEDWITKGRIYDFSEFEGYSPETGSRLSRELAEEGKIAVDYYKGKRGQTLAKYARLNTPKVVKPKVEIIEINGQLLARVIN